MPQIIVTAGNAAHEDEPSVTLRERINASDFDSERFAANLVERIGWAVLDATEAEGQEPEPTPRKRERPITGNRRRTERSEHPRDSDTESHLEPVGSA
jgi:hypothetical protein